MVYPSDYHWIDTTDRDAGLVPATYQGTGVQYNKLNCRFIEFHINSMLVVLVILKSISGLKTLKILKTITR